ncbi:hydroxymethylbilane synthase [Streptococcus cuniculi]|uniref:Porphobilinogen deaminase n=1 Tax=Streptococcus cuniculi TaxID=1432788 RepID=A0A4Y9JFC0_9STRE|nr:hydroxymethylbilane synthase [Streptococcus cuniculi]MBF0777629.1 hydroxymethylbilane synthase [Streptococcus cuniculi]TFU98669.1 hydroxymethylbilane synthase [Streptococcus cuniculi]
MTTIKVGTRKSKLAQTQTKQTLALLQEKHPEVVFELVPYQTKGDRLNTISLQEIGGKGVFVKEIERALLEQEIDIAIHSLKDMPALLVEGCQLGAIPAREDVRDCLIFHQVGQSLATLPKGARVGTSSLRRKVQLLKIRPDLTICELRGNIDTRIEKVQEGEYDAIVLAMAGLSRMGWLDHPELSIEPLGLEACLPAISQGALAIECRKGDDQILDILQSIQDEETAACVTIEREVLALMNADCTFPIGAYAQKHLAGYQLDVMLATKEGECLYARVEGSKPEGLAKRAVETLAAQGAWGIS